MMSMTHESRSVAIIRHVNDFLLSTSTSSETFADDVKVNYYTMVTDERARVMKFHEGRDLVADMKANGQLIMRILNRAVKFPADLEEAMVQSLPKSRKSKLLSELVGRYGLLPVAIPDVGSVESSMASISQLLIEAGEVVSALGPVVADGVVDDKDAPHVAEAVKEIDDVLAQLLSWRVKLKNIESISD